MLHAEAQSRHAPLHEIAVVENDTNFQGPLGGQGGRCYHPVNLALAKAALRCLLLLSPPPDSPPLAAAAADTGEEARDAAVVAKGWDRAFWPGRFEVFSDQRALGPGLKVVLDVAHNVDSVARLLAEAKGRFGSGEAAAELWVLFGTGNDKDAMGMLARLLQRGESGASVRRLALCQAANARAVPVNVLAALATRAQSESGSGAAGAVVVVEAGGAVAPGPVLERLLREALTESAATPVVLLVCGSFYVVAAARAHLAATRPGLFVSRKDWAFHPDPPLGGSK